MAGPRFHTLTVSAIARTGDDAVVVTLDPPADFPAFAPGQYLTLNQD